MAHSSKEIRVVLVDDHKIVRQGLASMLSQSLEIEVVGQAATGEDAVRLILDTKPDVAVIDLNLPDQSGFEVSSTLRAEGSMAPLVILTMHHYESLVAELKRHGIPACVLKEDAYEDLEMAIFEARDGGEFFSRSFDPEEEMEGSMLLSPREKQITKMIIGGLINKEIADRLSLSAKTVETHRERLMKKLGARNTADIVRKGMEMGLG